MAKRGNANIASVHPCCNIALTEFKRLLLDFFNIFDLQLILALLLYDSRNFVIN